MALSIDLRKRIRNGLDQGIAPATLAVSFKWAGPLSIAFKPAANNLGHHCRGTKPSKIDRAVLEKHVAEFPNATLKERAVFFGASAAGVFYALNTSGFSYKKDARFRERDEAKRAAYAEQRNGLRTRTAFT